MSETLANVFHSGIVPLVLGLGGLAIAVFVVWILVRVGSVAYYKTREQHIRRVLHMQREMKGNDDG